MTRDRKFWVVMISVVILLISTATVLRRSNRALDFVTGNNPVSIDWLADEIARQLNQGLRTPVAIVNSNVRVVMAEQVNKERVLCVNHVGALYLKVDESENEVVLFSFESSNRQGNVPGLLTREYVTRSAGTVPRTVAPPWEKTYPHVAMMKFSGAEKSALELAGTAKAALPQLVLPRRPGLWPAPFNAAQAAANLEQRAVNTRDYWREVLRTMRRALWAVLVLPLIGFLWDGRDFVKKDWPDLHRFAEWREEKDVKRELWRIWFTPRNLKAAVKALQGDLLSTLTPKQQAARSRSPDGSLTVFKNLGADWRPLSRYERKVEYQKPARQSENGCHPTTTNGNHSKPTSPPTFSRGPISITDLEDVSPASPPVTNKPLSVRELEDEFLPLALMSSVVPKGVDAVIARYILLDLLNLGGNGPIAGGYHRKNDVLKLRIQRWCDRDKHPYSANAVTKATHWLIGQGLVLDYSKKDGICLNFSDRSRLDEAGMIIFRKSFSARLTR